MRYAAIRDMDISNGEGIGVALFTQGCHFHCDGCFNKETWDFNGGAKWQPYMIDDICDLLNKEYISRFSILGGEPLELRNILQLTILVHEVKRRFGNDKKIWLYTGYNLTDFMKPSKDFNMRAIQDLLLLCDYVVDGQFIEEFKDISLSFRGSSNQHITDMRKYKKDNNKWWKGHTYEK